MTPQINQRLAALAAEVEADQLAWAAGKLTAEEIICRAEKRAVDNSNIGYYLRFLSEEKAAKTDEEFATQLTQTR